MKVNKIIHKSDRPNDDGDWLVWAMVYINGDYRYCALMYDTFAEAQAVHEGQKLDVEKTRFSFRTLNNGQL